MMQKLQKQLSQAIERMEQRQNLSSGAPASSNILRVQLSNQGCSTIESKKRQEPDTSTRKGSVLGWKTHMENYLHTLSTDESLHTAVS